MKSLSMLVTALNTLAVSLGLTYSALALDPEVLYQRSSPAVVSIEVPKVGSGSGFIANAQGMILTNSHVVGTSRQVIVRLADGSTYPGVVVSRNPQVDLALIQIRSKRRLPSLRFQPVPPKVGQRAFAIGNPRGLTRTLSDGIVSRIDQSGQIQFTATSSFGGSGGPLLDDEGNVIGVVRGGYPGTNLNFAIPIAAVNRLPGRRSTVAQQRQQVQNYFLASNLQIRQGNYQKALAILNEAIRRYPNDEGLYSNRGAVKSMMRDYQGALNDYVRSIQLRPTSLTYSNQARIYAVLKQPQQALKALTEAIRINREWGEGNLGEGFYDRGRVYSQLGNSKAAIADFKQAARFFSRMSNVERYRAAVDQITLLNAE
ncbi:trypsin-like peptidase domain-containing protein [Leptolyngbya sp. AN03gr2]|uniref:trypsin-like peptidase domain-containing protein n=1 Tax=unclassified Leptolyngbya TaxID=2650499 RepID=UPI003D312521